MQEVTVRAELHMVVRAGREAEFEAAWCDVADWSRHAPGNLRQALLRDLEDPSKFVVTSDWQTREAFKRFEQSPEQDAATARLRELRVSAMMVVRELLHHVEGGGGPAGD